MRCQEVLRDCHESVHIHHPIGILWRMNYRIACLMMVCVSVWGVASVMAQQPATPVTAAAAGGAEQWYQRLIAALDGIEADMPKMSQSANEAAKLYVNDNLPIAAVGDRVFTFEAVGRCGGMMSIEHVNPDKQPQWKGIVLYALQGPGLAAEDARQIQLLHDRGCKIIAFGRGDWIAQCAATKAIDWSVDNHTTGPDGLFAAADGKRIVPVHEAANVLALWSWTGEFVASCTRLGRMPTMYKGFVFAGGPERAQKIGKAKFHDTVPTPVEPLVAGQTYLRELRKCLVDLHATQMDPIKQAAAKASTIRAAGKKMYCLADGHTVGNMFRRSYDPGFFIELGPWSPSEVIPPLQADELLFALGYTSPFMYDIGKAGLQACKTSGVTVIGAARALDDTVKTSLPKMLFIDEKWPDEDCIVQFPGYDIKVLPPSGVMQLAVYEMICAEMVEPAPAVK